VRGGLRSPGSYLKIAGRAAGERWVGRMAHLAVYDRTLDADTVRSHHATGRPRFESDERGQDRGQDGLSAIRRD
jgi:hypothetical protein